MRRPWATPLVGCGSWLARPFRSLTRAIPRCDPSEASDGQRKKVCLEDLFAWSQVPRRTMPDLLATQAGHRERTEAWRLEACSLGDGAPTANAPSQDVSCPPRGA